MTLTAAFAGITTACSPEPTPAEATIVPVKESTPTEPIRIDTLYSKHSEPDTAHKLVPKVVPDVIEPHHSAGIDCPGCGRG